MAKKDKEVKIPKERFRKWHIVSHDESETPQQLYDELTKVKSTHYCIIGKEYAPTTNKLHFHIYCEFDNACTFESIQKIFPKAHIEKANGTASQNKAYISKEGDYIEYGVPTPVKYSNDDIALNIVCYMQDNPQVELFNVAMDCPEFSDYIVKNYNNLSKLHNDIKEAMYKMQQLNKQ